MGRDISVAGSLVRLVVGAGLLVVTALVGVGWWDLGAALVLYPVLAVVTAAVVARLVPDLGRGLGGSATGGGWSASAAWASVGIGLFVIAVGTALSFVTPIDGGSLYLFFGGSMLIAALMGYAGCEVLALPNLVLRRRDQIWCLLYSPLDRAEHPS